MPNPIPDSVRHLVVDYALVGSRITCRPAPAGTDQDVLVFVKEPDFGEFADILDLEGFGLEGSKPSDAFRIDAADAFQSFRFGDLNFIVTASEEFYQRFTAASSIAKRFNLLDKADRIALFQAVLYGNPDTQD